MHDAAASAGAPAADPPRLNILLSWAYARGDLLARIAALGPVCRLLLDSGAFTAFKAGRSLSLDDYCRFLETLRPAPWRYFALDVIGNPEATQKNYRVMMDRGFRPVPVFTRGEALSVLDEYFETSDLVGLGGVAGADKSAYAWARWVMQHVAGRRVHILGFTDMDWVKYLRPYAVDSSSWDRVGRFGLVNVYMGQGRIGGLTHGSIRAGSRPHPAVEAAIARVGGDPAALARAEAWRRVNGEAATMSAAAWVACSLDMERLIGTKLFLAVVDKLALGHITAALDGMIRVDHPAARLLAASL